MPPLLLSNPSPSFLQGLIPQDSAFKKSNSALLKSRFAGCLRKLWSEMKHLNDWVVLHYKSGALHTKNYKQEKYRFSYAGVKEGMDLSNSKGNIINVGRNFLLLSVIKYMGRLSRQVTELAVFKRLDKICLFKVWWLQAGC